ncbi:MAG: hypothetical protein K8W52_02985, partial [Deltaproteobacteria bacterium]|nr:hypothetical protein [Deltaproteobacteria bacterium]
GQDVDAVEAEALDAVLVGAHRAVGGEDAWREVLATGELAARRWIAVADGRVALARAVARFLDGAAPEHVGIVGDDPAPERLRGAHLAALGDAPTTTVAAMIDSLAARLGRVAVATPGADLAAALIEADLARAILVIPPRTARAAALAAWAHTGAGVILWPGAVPLVLAALPRWT